MGPLDPAVAGSVAELRPLFAPPDPAQRTFYRPDELAHFDLWQPDVPIPLGHEESRQAHDGGSLEVLAPVRGGVAPAAHPVARVDEVGYIPLEAEASNLFFQLISSRYERASVIVTSNKPLGRWGEVFGDDTVATMIDG